MELQAFLRGGGTLADLQARYAIKARRHVAHSSLVLLKYNQIESPMGERIVQEARGVILDEADGWRCVSRSFDKFFNHGESHAAPIDWATARVQEKVDGSLCSLYWHAGEWHVATTGTPDASGDLNGFGRTFAALFWETWANCQCALPGDEARGVTFLMELTSPWNRIVVQHAASGLTLLGARRATGEWLTLDDAAALLRTVGPVQEFPLQSFEDIAATFASLSPLATEGYVVVDGEHRRVKVKHPGYVALHHAKDGMSMRAFVEMARSGETGEVIAAFPEFASRLTEVRERYESMVAEVANDYERLRAIPEQKAFAIEATKTRCSSALFMTRAGKCTSVRRYLESVPADKMVQWLGLKDEPQAEAA
jgi:hypothetical protein